jgi:hypothetical protein
MKLINIILTLSILTACSSTTFKTDYDKSTDFSLLKTYSWGENSILLKKSPQASDVIIKRVAKMAQDDIQPILNHEFTSKGLKHVDNGEADMIIHYSAVGDTTNKFGQSNFTPGNVEGRSKMEQEGAMMIGTITLSIIAAKTNEVVWRGECAAFITGDGTNNTRLKKILAELVKDFPPNK